MHASIDDISLLPASALLARLRATAPHLQRRVPLQDDASRWHTLRIGGRTYRAALPITFTPYASVRPCSARCGFCSENLRQHRGGRAAATLRPGPAYFQQLSAVLQLLGDVPLSYSLSGLEMTDDAAWLQTLLQTLATTPNGPRIEQRVLYSNGAGLARADGARLIEALVAFGLSWVELSRHHPLQERNDAIMRFRPDEPIADVATFVQTARRLAARLPLRLVCIVQRGGVDTLLAECMQQPWWSRWQPDGLTEGYYFWNVRLRDRAGLQVVFESADYAAMHARHATGDLYKLVFFANGRLCAGWDPDADVLWEPIDG
ncbi:hypothetical protein Xazr_20065 [Xanthomonas campestris pv. azadirachtae]|nr:hypothetical protein Xazr_20065 [Xanthomonas campestris pv. azadirachtae]